MYIQEVARNMVVIMILYVDDMLLMSNDARSLSVIKIQLSTQFQMKDLREEQYILGIKYLKGTLIQTIGLIRILVNLFLVLYLLLVVWLLVGEV